MVKKIYYSALLGVIKREIKRISENWILLFITLIAPVIAYFTIMWMFSDGVIRNVPIYQSVFVQVHFLNKMSGQAIQ